MKINNDDLQRVWIREVKGTSPFNVLDQLGSLAKKIELLIEDEKGFEVKEFVLNQHQSIINKLSNNKQFKLGEKYSSNYRKSFCGLLMGSWFNNTEDI